MQNKSTSILTDVISLYTLLQGRHALGPGQYELSSFTDKWQDEHNVFKGKLGKIDQYPSRPAERMHCSTLSQWPRPAVSLTCLILFYIFNPKLFTSYNQCCT